MIDERGNLPPNAKRVGDVQAIIFSPTTEEIKCDEVKKENDNLKKRLIKLEKALEKLL